MSNKTYDLEIENATLSAKLRVAVHLLRKAKTLITFRKRELDSLRAELARKTKLLHDEMIAHEKTNQKLAQTMHSLTQRFPDTVITTNANFMAQLAYLEQLKSD